MGGADDVGVLNEWVVLRRFLAEDIERCLGNLATLDSLKQIFLVDDTATGDVDDTDALLALCKHLQWRGAGDG